LTNNSIVIQTSSGICSHEERDIFEAVYIE
jgi:hypothetical protein